MLTTEMLCEATAKATYKLGWTLQVKEYNDLEGPFLFIHAYVPNAYAEDPASSDNIELRIASPIPPVYTEEEYLRWLMWRLKMVEVHELMEWFRVEGKLFDDPHRPK